MADKTAPLGICDYCGGEIRDTWYTSKGAPRRHCGRQCRNAGNSKAGNPVRIRKVRQRVEAGQWVNPLTLESAETKRDHLRKAADGSRRARLAEIGAGNWRNPALTPAARAKLSRPRTIDDPVLHRAQERLYAGELVADLAPEERDALRAHEREMAQARKERQTPEQKERRRRQWRESKRR